MRVHAVQTGTVAIRERQRRGEGRGALRLLRTALGGAWTEPLPIWSWVIEHPEGVIVVATSTGGTRTSGATCGSRCARRRRSGPGCAVWG
jgi:hypothetical protein